MLRADLSSPPRSVNYAPRAERSPHPPSAKPRRKSSAPPPVRTAFHRHADAPKIDARAASQSRSPTPGEPPAAVTQPPARSAIRGAPDERKKSPREMRRAVLTNPQYHVKYLLVMPLTAAL